MTLFSDNSSHYSHRVRLVLAEKGVTVELVESESGAVPAELGDLNPYNTMPTLVDRELVLYESKVMMEYLDERFPHPPLMPSDPTTRAKARVMMSRLRRDWLDDVQNCMSSGAKLEKSLNRSLSDGLVAMSNHFTENKYVLGEEFSLVDAYLAVLLWRLPRLQVNLPRQGGRILDYGKRMFAKQEFQESLSAAEREMRAD